MRKLGLPIAALLLLSGRALAGVPALQQEDAKAKADKWIMQADSTKALVESVLAGAIEAGAEDHAVRVDDELVGGHDGNDGSLRWPCRR